MEEHTGDSKSGVYLFGRDIMAIPCFRKSALAGVSSCIASTLLSFLLTSNGVKSSRIGFWTLVGVTFPFWFVCREREYNAEIQLYQVQKELQQQAAEEYLILDSLEFGPETSG